MKALDRLPGCSEFPGQIKHCKFCSVLERIPCHDDSLFRKQVRARIPHHANHLLWERDPSIDAVILLPKSAGFPGYLRSEEHTSELQSHSDILCRFLLVKKKRLTTTPS